MPHWQYPLADDILSGRYTEKDVALSQRYGPNIGWFQELSPGRFVIYFTSNAEPFVIGTWDEILHAHRARAAPRARIRAYEPPRTALLSTIDFTL